MMLLKPIKGAVMNHTSLISWVAFTAITISSTAFANSSLPNNRHISVTGNAQLSAKPDIAIVHLQVEDIQTESAMAKKEVDKRVNQLLDGLATFNIDEENVSASNISTQPHYNYSRNNKREIDGYKARRSLKVTLNNLKHLNAFMDFALSVKINEIRNIELKSSKEDALKNEVNALAVADAKSKGQSLAQAFDAKLGRIYSINATSNNSYHRFGSNQEVERMAMSVQMDKSAPGRYLQENIVYNASISVVFDLDI